MFVLPKGRINILRSENYEEENFMYGTCSGDVNVTDDFGYATPRKTKVFIGE